MGNLLSDLISLDTPGKAYTLALLGHYLTIRARGYYASQGGDNASSRKLSTFNELQHLVSGQVAKLVKDDPLRYPDDVFLSILREKAGQEECNGELDVALEEALRVGKRH